MFVTGIDIGSLSAKVIILKDDRIFARAISRTGADTNETARRVMRSALVAGPDRLGLKDMAHIVSSGYGRLVVPFSNSNVTEISCHARGNHWISPEVRTILDMGGQDCKAIRCNKYGKATNFVMNEKCAAGTGRYLERINRILGVELDEIGPKSLEVVEGAAKIKSYCAVFAQRDAVSLLREGRHLNDILAGACEAIVSRVYSLLQKVSVEEVFAISGGVGKNVGVVKRLEQKLGVKAFISSDPEFMGAIGAALFARERANK